jgi:hypothetical protein
MQQNQCNCYKIHLGFVSLLETMLFYYLLWVGRLKKKINLELINLTHNLIKIQINFFKKNY